VVRTRYGINNGLTLSNPIFYWCWGTFACSSWYWMS